MGRAGCLGCLGVQLRTITQHPQTRSPGAEATVITAWVFRSKRRFVPRVLHVNNRDCCVVKHLPWKSIRCCDPCPR